MFYNLETTNFCNLQCKSCPTRLNLRPKGYMKPETFRSIINQMLAGREGFNRDRIVMHGYGEVLLSPYFFENLDYLQSKGFVNVDFSDNCMLMTEEIIRKLCSYTCLNYIKLSLNSSRKDLMERINTGSDFDKVVKNIQTVCDVVKECGSPFKIQVQLMHTNLNLDESPQEVKDLIGRDNFDVLECRIMSMLDMDKDNELLIPNSCFWNGECVFAQVSMMFHWDGDIVGCCVDNTKRQLIGNEKDGIFSKEVQDKIKKFREELQNNNCLNLPACARCEGKKK